MSEHVTPEAGHGHAAEGHGHKPAFNEAEMAAFLKSDIGAGAAVIVLMTAIFSIGLLLYAAIAFIVAA
jgi:hypothetical protein